MKELVKTVLGFNVAALPLLVRSGPRSFSRACSRTFSTMRQSKGVIDIPEIALGEILGDRKPVIQMAVQRYEDGALPSDQAMVLLAILAAEQPREVLEVGTYMGHTTRLMAENLPSSIIHTVDLPETFTSQADTNLDLPKDDLHLIGRRTVGREFKGRPCESRIRQHFGDSAAWNFSEAGTPSAFFIDGAHTYEYCKNDSEKCLAIAAPSATFLWHDVDALHDGVVRSLMEWRQQGRDVRRIGGTPLGYWKRT